MDSHSSHVLECKTKQNDITCHPTAHVMLSKCLEEAAVQFDSKLQRKHHVFDQNICCSLLLARSHVHVARTRSVRPTELQMFTCTWRLLCMGSLRERDGAVCVKLF